MEYEVRFRGKQLTASQLLQQRDFTRSTTSVIAAGFDRADPNRVHAFPSESDFDSWIENTKHSGKIREARNSMAKVKQRGDRDREVLVQRHEQEMKRVTREAEKLSRETGLPWPSPELFRIGHDRGVFHSILLCDFPNYSTSGLGWRFFNIPGIPDLGWAQFDNAASSYMVSGFGAMYENPWFGGRAFWTMGVPVWGVPDLAVFGWNNIASSLWITGP